MVVPATPPQDKVDTAPAPAPSAEASRPPVQPEPVSPLEALSDIPSLADIHRERARTGRTSRAAATPLPPEAGSAGAPTESAGGTPADDAASHPTNPPTSTQKPEDTSDGVETPPPSDPAGTGAGSEVERLTGDLQRMTGELLTAQKTIQDLQRRIPTPLDARQQEINQQALAVRLPDDEFEDLMQRRARETVDGKALTPAENAKLDRAIQIRDWSAAWYQDATVQADNRYRQRESTLLDQIAQGLRETASLEGINAQTIIAAETTADIYRHYYAEGGNSRERQVRAQLEPTIQEQADKIAELEAALASAQLRPGGGGTRTLPVGGSPTGGGFTPQLDYHDADGHALLMAAHEARRSNRR